MFLGRVAEVDYVAPWTSSCDQRLRMLRRRGATRRVAYLYEAPDTSTFRYRVHNMIEALALTRPEIAAAWFAQAEIEQLADALAGCDALVICRTRYTHALNHLVTRARGLGVTTVFDCDDLIFDVGHAHLILSTLDQKLDDAAWNFWFAMIGRLGATLRLCDRVIVTNDYLAGKALQFAPDKDVRVVPNFLNRAQVALSSRIFEAKRAGGWQRDGRFHLGYFSGTPTHNRDFAIVAGAIAELMDDDPRVHLRLVGFMQLDGTLARHAARIDRHELQDFLNLQRLIGEVELNLTPLQRNAFTHCKSELKYFEAAAVGTVTVASPSFTLARAIEDGVNGYLAPSHCWLETLRRAIDGMADYPAMAERAWAHVQRTYLPERQAEAICAALWPPPGRESATLLACAP